ncbi:MAG: glutamine--fructose-6-phosphate transaminase (isomerizing) [Candidatus Saccharimonadales bacterium]
MCGIVGYIGKDTIGSKIVLEGLNSLEYRGYDSAGLAYIHGQQLTAHKQIGRVKGLHDMVGSDKNAQAASGVIGHTRWATHGRPSLANAHPHCNTHQSIMVVHNGIIENYQDIKDKLAKEGYNFTSETDTEVLAHLIDYYYVRSESLGAAITRALHDLRGAYAILVLSSIEPDNLYAARLSSPLVLGIADNGTIVASDPGALVAHTKKVVYIDDYELATIHKNGKFLIHNFKDERAVDPSVELLDVDDSAALLGSFPHFMLKEMHDVPATIRAATQGRLQLETSSVKLGGLESAREQLRYIDRIVIVACGTSYYAGLVGEYLLEEIAGISVEVQLASEFKYRSEPFSRSTALLAISQSGETADTIAALKKVEAYGVLRLGIVNTVGSTIARMTDAGVYCHAGPEKAVASTKAFIAQVTVLTLIALHLSDGKSPLYKPVLHELSQIAAKAEQVLGNTKAIKKIAKKYAANQDFLYIGRGYQYPCALEGALKLKEVSYLHAEGYAAGEMKHGPLAMIDRDFPTFAIATNSNLLQKTLSNIEEIRARNGPVIALTTQGNKSVAKLTNDVLYVPESLEQLEPVLTALAMQLFAYYVAASKGYDVDHPRNLAKSVTVE